ncbi:MAG: phosphatidate cytidylyltransferase [Clostridia bacterium]|nr:phosphatidate cytidylyltransferase [Clostridia bacterium]
MGKRLLTSFIGIFAFFAVMLSPKFVLYAAIMIFTIGMLFEMYRVMCVGRFLRGIGYISAVIICLGFVLHKYIAALLAVILIFMLAMIAMHGKVTSKKVLAVGFITLMISVFMSILILTRRYAPKYSVILPFVCAWMTDTGAFLIGNMWGKHKLAEHISPKKTVEGAIGGVIFSIIGSVAFLYIVAMIEIAKAPLPVYVVKFAILGLFASVISQLGDLAASCIKRDFEKKDYGKILPGHGGLLDRFDSVLFAIPFVHYAIMMFIL